MRRSTLLVLDGIGNLILGLLLLLFPAPLIELLGMPLIESVFYPSLFGAVLLGIGVALVVERLSGNLLKSALETWQVTLAPGASSGSDVLQYEGEELVVCGEGLVTFRISEEEYRLHAGDCLHFRACLPHSWYNDGPGRAQFTITGSLPYLFRSLMQSRVPRPPVHVEEHPPLSA